MTEIKGCCVPPKKGGEEARGFGTVRGAPQNGDGRVEASLEPRPSSPPDQRASGRNEKKGRNTHGNET